MGRAVPQAGTAAPAAAALALSAATPDPAPAAPWPVLLVTPANLPDLAPQSMAALRDALAKSGLDPASVKMSYWEELVSYPGGNWVNRMLTVQGPNGRRFDFDAAATLRCPDVTAREFREFSAA